MQYGRPHWMDTLFMLLLFCLFTVLSLILILIGAHAYNGIVGDMNRNNEMRASLSYVANKVRAGDEAGAVQIEQQDSMDVLTINSTYGEEKYKTYIYLYNGYIMEQFAKDNQQFKPGSGDKITKIKAFTMKKSENNLLKFSATDDEGRQLSLQVCLRS